MRRSALFVTLAMSGMLGCATAPVAPGAVATQPKAAAKAPPPAAAKREVTVYGRGAPSPPPGEISIDPRKQGMDFTIVPGRVALRCTKTDSKDPDEREYCRNLNNGDSRNPDPGRLERSKTQSGWH
jgi:hypothetical protein